MSGILLISNNRTKLIVEHTVAETEVVELNTYDVQPPHLAIPPHASMQRWVQVNVTPSLPGVCHQNMTLLSLPTFRQWPQHLSRDDDGCQVMEKLIQWCRVLGDQSALVNTP